MQIHWVYQCDVSKEQIGPWDLHDNFDLGFQMDSMSQNLPPNILQQKNGSPPLKILFLPWNVFYTHRNSYMYCFFF